MLLSIVMNLSARDEGRDLDCDCGREGDRWGMANRSEGDVDVADRVSSRGSI